MQGYRLDFNTVMILGIPIWIIVRIITLIIRKRSSKKIIIGKEIVTNLFAIYILCLVGVTLFPIEIMYGEELAEVRSILTLKERLGINIIPLIDYINDFYILQESKMGYFYLFRCIAGNIILLSPFIGYLLMYKESMRNLKNIIIVSFTISLFIELFQLFENITYLSGIVGRTVNIDDLLLNTVGGILAYYLFKFLYKTKLRIYLCMD